jgi:hypothetical protein
MTIKKFFITVLFLSFALVKAQQVPNRFVVTAKINQILEKRADCFASTKTSMKYYHIQLYNGQSIDKARAVKSQFQTDFPGTYVIVEWESPEFKVWAGEYENKLSADQALLKIKKKYPNAFIVNPKK